MPDAGTTNEPHAQIQQSVMELWRSIADRSRAIELIDRVIAHHAPELYGWAAQVVGRALPGQAAWERKTAVETPDAAARRVYQSLFGVEPTVTAAVVPAAGNVSKAPERGVWIDPELARLAVVLHLGAQFRIWSVGQQMTREGDGSGQIARAALRDTLAKYGVVYTPRHFKRLLDAGEGTFWNVDGERIFLRGWQFVALRLVDAASAQHADAVERNKPGARRIKIHPAGTIEQFEAQVYAAWLTHRENPTIARATLSMLFGRDKRTIRRWETSALAGTLHTRSNFAQCPDWQHFFDSIPPHAGGYQAQVRFRGRVTVVPRVRWQLPNTYIPATLNQHNRRGQASKVRRAVNAHMDMPADERRGGLHLVYVEKPETVRRIAQRMPDALPVYVWRGENRRKQGIFEINDNGFVETHATEQLETHRRRRWRQP